METMENKIVETQETVEVVEEKKQFNWKKALKVAGIVAVAGATVFGLGKLITGSKKNDSIDDDDYVEEDDFEETEVTVEDF